MVDVQSSSSTPKTKPLDQSASVAKRRRRPFRCPRKSVDNNFKIGNEPIEIVQPYTYLGTSLTPTGNFTLALEHLYNYERKSRTCLLQCTETYPP